MRFPPQATVVLPDRLQAPRLRRVAMEPAAAGVLLKVNVLATDPAGLHGS